MTALSLPLTAARGQESGPPSMMRSTPVGIAVRPEFQRTDISSGEQIVLSAPAGPRRLHTRSVVIGGLLGGAIGAVAGHQISAGQSSCPTSPGYSCGERGFGTISGAVSGAIIGGVAGFLVSRSR